MSDEQVTPDDEQKKIELLRLITDAAAKVPQLETLGQEIVQFSRFTGDVAGPLQEMVQQMPASGLTPAEWDAQLDSWRTWHRSADGLNGTLTNVNSFTAVTNTVVSYSASGVLYPSQFLNAPPPPPTLVPPTFAAPRVRLFRTLEQFPLEEKAKQAMIRLGLDSRAGTSRTPLDLLNEACAAMRTPSVPSGRPTSTLLPLRECIDASVAELLRRRQTQSPAPGRKGKIIALGQACARAGLPPDHFDRLGDEAEKVMDVLSGSKQADHPRDRVIDLFYQGLLYLNGLLESINETALRTA